MKMTEQGEVLSAKYSVAEIARRELELVASAVLLSTLSRDPHAPEERMREYEATVQRMSDTSQRAYRGLVYDDDEFEDFFRQATPVEEISRQQLGSRPPKRGKTAGIEDFRAIPWVFSWTQSRMVLPAWYGLGTALEEAIERTGWSACRRWRATGRSSPRCSPTPRWAARRRTSASAAATRELCEDEALRERVWSAIAGEFERTTRAAGRDRRRRRAAQPRAGPARLDRPPQPVRGPALLRAARAAAAHARGRRGAGRRAGPREPARPQRHRERAAQHRMTPTAPISPPSRSSGRTPSGRP